MAKESRKQADTSWLDGPSVRAGEAAAVKTPAAPAAPPAPAPVAPAAPGLVKVLSLREGDLILPRGTLRKHGIMEMSQAEADALVFQFPEHVKIV